MNDVKNTVKICDANELKINLTLDESSQYNKEKNQIVINPFQCFIGTKYNQNVAEFITAHEIGHHKFRKKHKQVGDRILYSHIGTSMLSIFLPMTLPANIALQCAIVACTSTLLIYHKRKNELECDSYAKKMVGSKGGIEFFKHGEMRDKKYWAKLSWYQKIRKYDYFHPPSADRIKNLCKEN